MEKEIFISMQIATVIVTVALFVLLFRNEFRKKE